MAVLRIFALSGKVGRECLKCDHVILKKDLQDNKDYTCPVCGQVHLVDINDGKCYITAAEYPEKRKCHKESRSHEQNLKAKLIETEKRAAAAEEKLIAAEKRATIANENMAAVKKRAAAAERRATAAEKKAAAFKEKANDWESTAEGLAQTIESLLQEQC